MKFGPTPALYQRESTEGPAKQGSAEILETTRRRVSETYGKLPLSFEANQGQADSSVKFLSRGSGYHLLLTSTEAVLTLRKDEGGRRKEEVKAVDSSSSELRMKLVGANPAPRVMGLERLPGKSNYLTGNDPRQWRTNIPTYAKVKYQELYPDVDLLYYGNQHQLEYDFLLAPGADPKTIRMAFTGADKLTVNPEGHLVLETAGGQIQLDKPLIYQEVEGTRQEIAGGYVLKGEQQVGFEVGSYDAARPLVIDPVLSYSTYLGGSNEDSVRDITVDSPGNVYLTGFTRSINFPTANPLQPGYGGSSSDAFVTKLSADGSALLYSTYLGGSNIDIGHSIAVDVHGNAYLTGETRSTDFPTKDAIQPVFNGGGSFGTDAFVVKLNATGSAFIYSTYLGGSSDESGRGIALDSIQNAYITGGTKSVDFPLNNPIQPAFGGASGSTTQDGDVFVTKLDANGAAFVYSTFLGGSGDDGGRGIAIGSGGAAYITGITSSTNFPTQNPLQPSYAGGSPFPGDAFVTKLNAEGSALVYSTYLGGTGTEDGADIAVSVAGNAYVTGMTVSSDFPTANALQPVAPGNTLFRFNGYVSVLDQDGSGFVYSTYLGGSESDRGNGIAVDARGNVYVAGETRSTDFPTADPLQPAFGGGSFSGDAFVAKLNAAGSVLIFSTYLGGREDDRASAIAVDFTGSAYVAGNTNSTDYPTANPLQPASAGGQDVFITKIGAVADLLITKTVAPNPVIAGSNLTYTITLTNQGPDAASGIRITDILPNSTTFVSCSATGGGLCTGIGNNRTISFSPLAVGASETVTLVATLHCSVANGAAISNTASVRALTPDPSLANNSATVTATASNPPGIITLQDESSGDLLRFNSLTGDYTFSSDGFTLTGRGRVTRSGCGVILLDLRSDRLVTAFVNECQHTGNALVQLFSPKRQFTIRDRDITNNTCTRPPA